MTTANDMDELQKEESQARILGFYAQSALHYEQAHKTRLESFWYPVLIAGGLMTGGAAIVGAGVAAARLVWGA